MQREEEEEEERRKKSRRSEAKEGQNTESTEGCLTFPLSSLRKRSRIPGKYKCE